MSDSYPRLTARTLRFTLGVPRDLQVRGSHVYFVRTPDGVTRSGQLWSYAAERDTETLIADPAELLGTGEETLSAAERARRERSREGAGGLVGYSLDDDGRWAAFTLSGRLWATHLSARITRELPARGPVIDPRVDPRGRHIAYATAGELRVITVRGHDDRALVSPETDTEVWGQAEFIAAEEMNRFRGFWWSPDGTSLLVERSDDTPIQTWHISDPADPAAEPRSQRYPAAGTPNADVTLWHVTLAGERSEIVWDREAYEYLARVSWTSHGAPLIQVLSRDQRRSQILEVDVETGETSVLREYHDEDWVELLATPQFAEGGRLVTLEDVGRSRRLVVDGEPLTREDWHVRQIVRAGENDVTFTYSFDPAEIHVARVTWNGEETTLTEGRAVHGAAAGRDTVVITRSGLDSTDLTVDVRHRVHRGSIDVLAEPPGFHPHAEFLRTGPFDCTTAVLFPRHHSRGFRKLPILAAPYGGPHAQKALASARAMLEAQWMADQGFCVVICDGRGTPGRGPAFERAVRDNLATATLQDQVDAVEDVIATYPDDVDATRVGITGWSYGGYLAALAVLRRPDVFHAAVAGAPVTEWRLYDTCYTERYLGDPNTQPDVYDRNSLLGLATDLERPLLLIHGLADDNVVAAHTLQLSSALLAAGRPHTVLPLSGVTHMTPQETVAENLKYLQIDFLKKSLGLAPHRSPQSGSPA